MKSIMYTFLVFFFSLLVLPQVAIGQSDGRTVITEEEFNNASKDKQDKIRSNPQSFIVVKDGKKVDVWNSEKIGSESSSPSVDKEGNRGSEVKKDHDISPPTGKSESARQQDVNQQPEMSVEQARQAEREAAEKMKATEKSTLTRDNSGQSPTQDELAEEEQRIKRESGDSNESNNAGSSSSVLPTSRDSRPLPEDATDQPTYSDQQVGTTRTASQRKADLFSGEGSISEQEFNQLTDQQKRTYMVKQREKIVERRK